MNSHEFNFKVGSKQPPIVEITDEGVYVWFKRGARAVKTIVRSKTPFVAVDIDENGDVIGIETVPHPEEMTLGKVAKMADVSVSKRSLAAARYMRSAPVLA